MKTRLFPILTACLFPIFLLIVTIQFINPVFAENTAVFTVTSIADTDDGTCDANCTLREAIDTANTSIGADTIQFAIPDDSTILLGGTQLPEIKGILSIDGSTAVSLTISGNNSSRIFEIGIGTAVTLTDLIISDGFLTSTHPISDGAGIYVNNNAVVTINNTTFQNNYAGNDGGALYNYRGTVTLNNSTFTNNHADNDGGAFYNYIGTVTLNNTAFTSNNADDDGGAFVNHNGIATVHDSTFLLNTAADKAGGMYNDEDFAVATIYNTSVMSNTGNNGGGLRNYIGKLTIYNTSIMYNNATDEGGAIDNYLGQLAIYNSTLAYNHAQSYGGAILNNGEATGDPTVYNGSTYIQNSTLSHNSTNETGGAISLDEGTVILTNTTIYSNSAVVLGGGIEIYDGTIHMTNNIIAGSQSTGGDCVKTVIGTIATNDNNLIEDNSCTPAISGDPKIGSLSDNGGSTLTHALLDGSPAINAGNDVACPTTDQRGLIRPISGSGSCDLGAFEITWVIYLPVIFKN